LEIILTDNGVFHRSQFESEAALEKAIVEIQTELFGKNRMYLDVKKKIGVKGSLRNIPDGYLLDLSGQKPRLYVVENELAAHDPLRHIAVQILEFSLSFEAEPSKVRNILMDAIQSQAALRERCEKYALSQGFRNLDHMLDYLVSETPFAALVIIDEVPDNLEKILLTRFKFGVEVLELSYYKCSDGRKYYRFEPFLADVNADLQQTLPHDKQEEIISQDDIDTVVVPAREDGFQDVFLKENRWYAVRIHGTMRPQIKYIAVYQVAPQSAVTYVAPVSSIEPWDETKKFVVNFAEPARKIGPIPLQKNGKVKAPQNLRYTNYERLLKAKSLDDIWGQVGTKEPNDK
jgi:regulator of RNase E activity RraB